MFSLILAAVLVITAISALPDDFRQREPHPTAHSYPPQNLGPLPPSMSPYPPFPLYRRPPRFYKRAYYNLRRLFDRVFHSARRRGGSAMIKSGRYLLRNQSPAHSSQAGQRAQHTQHTQYTQYTRHNLHANQAHGDGPQLNIHV